MDGWMDGRTNERIELQSTHVVLKDSLKNKTGLREVVTTKQRCLLNKSGYLLKYHNKAVGSRILVVNFRLNRRYVGCSRLLAVFVISSHNAVTSKQKRGCKASVLELRKLAGIIK